MFSKIKSFFVTTYEVLAESSRGMQAAREVERLQRLSDQDLAKLGLRRTDIVQHAFRSMMH